MHVVLFQPEIPPNTGNVARLCAAMQVSLHLIEPLGFKLEDRYLKRAGLDYWPHVDMAVWPDLDAYIRNAGAGRRLVLTSARRGAALHRFEFTENDSLVFGRETSGLPPEVIRIMSASPSKAKSAASTFPPPRASYCFRRLFPPGWLGSRSKRYLGREGKTL